MKATVVRYQAKPERADENQALVEKVFADLEARQPDGFTYKVFRLEDGVSFIHVVIEHEVESPRLTTGHPGPSGVRGGHRGALRCPASSDGSNRRRRLSVSMCCFWRVISTLSRLIRRDHFSAVADMLAARNSRV